MHPELGLIENDDWIDDYGQPQQKTFSLKLVVNAVHVGENLVFTVIRDSLSDHMVEDVLEVGEVDVEGAGLGGSSENEVLSWAILQAMPDGCRWGQCVHEYKFIGKF